MSAVGYFIQSWWGWKAVGAVCYKYLVFSILYNMIFMFNKITQNYFLIRQLHLKYINNYISFFFPK